MENPVKSSYDTKLSTLSTWITCGIPDLHKRQETDVLVNNDKIQNRQNQQISIDIFNVKI